MFTPWQKHHLPLHHSTPSKYWRYDNEQKYQSQKSSDENGLEAPEKYTKKCKNYFLFFKTFHRGWTVWEEHHKNKYILNIFSIVTGWIEPEMYLMFLKDNLNNNLLHSLPKKIANIWWFFTPNALQNKFRKNRQKCQKYIPKNESEKLCLF